MEYRMEYTIPGSQALRQIDETYRASVPLIQHLAELYHSAFLTNSQLKKIAGRVSQESEHQTDVQTLDGTLWYGATFFKNKDTAKAAILFPFKSSQDPLTVLSSYSDNLLSCLLERELQAMHEINTFKRIPPEVWNLYWEEHTGL